MVVTVAAALDSLEVVALGSLNVAEAGAAAHYVQDNAGKHCTCAVGDTFLLQGYTGAGGGSDRTGAGAGCAVDHVDRRDFGLCLQEAAVYVGIKHTSGHVFRNLSLRGDGIAEEITSASSDGCLCNSFATLHKSFCHYNFLLNPSRCGLPRRGKCVRRMRSRCTLQVLQPLPGDSLLR